MRVVIQVSGKANCTVDHKPYSEIPRGLFVLVGFTEGDNEDKIKWMVNKIVNMRIFPKAEEDVGDISVKDINGEILSISFKSSNFPLASFIEEVEKTSIPFSE